MQKNRFGYLYILNTIVLFSTFEVVNMTLVGKINPFQINFIRFFIGGLFLLIFVIIKGDMAVGKKDFAYITAAGVVNVMLSMNLIQMSLYTANAKASVVAVIFSSNPVFVMAFSVLLDKEKINMYKILGLLLGISGTVVVCFDKLKVGSSDYKCPLLALMSSILYGLYTVIGRKASVRVGSLKMNSYSFLIGSLLLLPILLCFKVPVIKFDYSGIYQVAYLSLFVTGMAYLTYFKGLSITGASSGSLVFFVKPVLASLLAVLVLKEQVTFNIVFGAVLIIVGIFIVIYWESLKTCIRKILFVTE